MVANPEQDFVLKTVESRDVHFVRFWFTDVLGNMKSFAVVPGELESAFEEGMECCEMTFFCCEKGSKPLLVHCPVF